MAAGTNEVIGSGFVAKQREIRKQNATTTISWKGRRESGEAIGLNDEDSKISGLFASSMKVTERPLGSEVGMLGTAHPQ